jgi:hypothetical protein
LNDDEVAFCVGNGGSDGRSFALIRGVRESMKVWNADFQQFFRSPVRRGVIHHKNLGSYPPKSDRGHLLYYGAYGVLFVIHGDDDGEQFPGVSALFHLCLLSLMRV